VVGNLRRINRGRRLRCKDRRIRSTSGSGSAAACPESDPIVQRLDRRGPEERGHSEVHTAAREKKLSGLPVPWNGGFGLVRSRADASLGLANRADPTLHPKGMDPYLTGSRSE